MVQIRPAAWLLLLVVFGSSSGTAWAQLDEEDFPPGLHAKFLAARKTATRIVPDVSFDWKDGAPDQRLPAGPFYAEFTGNLLNKKSAAYTFHAYVEGTVLIEIDGKRVLAGKGESPKWIAGKPVELRAGIRKLRVVYNRTAKTGRLHLFWSADRFPLEPLPTQQLFHTKPANPAGRTPRDIETGRILFDAHRCNRCHVRENDPPSPPGPDLTHVVTNLTAAELQAKLLDPKHNTPRAKMPDFGFSKKEAVAIAAFLRSVSKPVKLPSLPKKRRRRRKSKEKPQPERRAGEVLFRSVGCLACHTMNARRTDFQSVPDGLKNRPTEKVHGNAGPYAGGDLTKVGRKRSAQWIAAWLKDPKKLNADHRMPVFKLSDTERRQLAMYLSSSSVRSDESAEKRADRAQIDLGKKLVEQSRCAACHTIPTIKPPTKPDLSLRTNNLRASCLSKTPNRKKHRPAYPKIDVATVAAYLKSRSGKLSPVSDFERGRRLLAQRNCTACHPRGLSDGIVETAGAMSKLDPELQGQSQALIPPSLNAVGDKLLDDYLKTAIAGEQKTVRMPWLRVRMPRFDHSKEDSAALVSYLKAHDRIPPRLRLRGDKPKTKMPSDSQILVAGQTLLGIRGFSCIACHKVGQYEPRNTAPGTRGSDLMSLAGRMRKPFFDRWTRAPIRIVPGMEMPSYHGKPVPGVLKDDVDLQLEVLWRALNDKRFKPPTNPSVVEQFITVKPGEPARIIRDVFTVPKENGGGYVARSLAIGLNNGHNLLFDLDTYSLRGWFFGDFARQRTQGKSWYWDMAGVPVMTGLKPGPDIVLVKKDKKSGKETVYLPRRVNGSVGRYRLDANVGHQFVFDVQLNFEIDGKRQRISIQEVIEPLRSESDGRTGWKRSLMMYPVNADGKRIPLPEFTAFVSRPSKIRGLSGVSITTKSSDKNKWRKFSDVQEREYTPVRFAFVPVEGKISASATILLYLARLKLERSRTKLKPKPVQLTPEIVDTVPGYSGTRLPISRSIMPTALTWSKRHGLAFTSLKGHLLISRDENKDGLEDSITRLYEGLAAPYGVLPHKDGFVVSHKPDLLVLHLNDEQEASARRVEATGWGYTDNYHDWTCGIVRDRKGNLYIGLGSDYAQPKRPKEHSRWRGKVLRVSPKGKITPVGHSFRYPTGLAMNHEGEIFVSDNQGVQNTFNEINHLKPGAHYGVPSRHETNRNAKVTPPAIQIPHPWTRSVNGIFFLPKEPPQRPAESRIGRERGATPVIEIRATPVVESRVTRIVSNRQCASREAATASSLGRQPQEKPGSSVHKPRRGDSGIAATSTRCRPVGAFSLAGPSHLGLTPQANRFRPFGTGAIDSVGQEARTSVPQSVAAKRKSYFVKHFAGHGIGCEYDNRFLIRFTLQKVDGEYQGACYAFSKPNSGVGGKNFTGPLCGGVAPDGAIYIGSIWDSGWLGGRNTGDIVRLVPNGKLPNGIRELRVTKAGFEIEFIRAIDRKKAMQPGAYSITGYNRIWKGAYYTPDSNRHTLQVTAVNVSKDNKTVNLTVPKRRTGGYLYEVNVGKISAKPQAALFPATGYYTLHRIPR